MRWEKRGKHYTKLRFGRALKQYEVNSHINQIETVQSG